MVPQPGLVFRTPPQQNPEQVERVVFGGGLHYSQAVFPLEATTFSVSSLIKCKSAVFLRELLGESWQTGAPEGLSYLNT